MPCTGPLTPSEAPEGPRGEGEAGKEGRVTQVPFSRLLVSASQDGKLIVWDTYTTNKVPALPTDPPPFLGMPCLISVLFG